MQSTTLPVALRPALYGALSNDAEPAYVVNKEGCAALPKQGLKACFDAHGAHFSGGASPLSLHLVAWGRSGTLTSMVPVRPEIEASRVTYLRGNLTEWWRVLPMGFEQGFTIVKSPRGRGELILALAATRPGASVSHTNGLAWGKLRYGELVVTDADGKVVPATLKSDGNRVLIAVNDTHAAYPLTVDPLVWIEQKVTANDGVAGDEFGYSVAVSGATAVIGAPVRNGLQGAAYVFSESAGTWTQTGELTAMDGAAGDGFGWSVALSGTTALIGAPFHRGQGAVYVFSESAGAWTQTGELTAMDGAAGDGFGWSVALSGATAVAGAPGGNGGTGTAYVFTRSGDDWGQVVELIASGGAAGDQLGWSVALSGATAVVGAPHGNGGTGTAYVFTGTGSDWSQKAMLTAGDGAAGDSFGLSVAISDATVVIGAFQHDDSQGAAYVFGELNGAWSQSAELVASDGATGGQFGFSVALSGATALVGSIQYLSNGPGAIYVFKKSNGTWPSTETRKLTASNGAMADQLGFSVALSGTTALAGAVGRNSNEGAAYFYGKSNLGLTVSAPQTVGRGQLYTSQTIATNSSSAASPAVSATISVPAAASFIAATASQGACSQASGVVTCDFGQIAGNAGMATANVILKATGASGTTIENTASIAKATPALTASAPTRITSPAACPAGYTEFSGHLDAGESFTSDPITVSEAGQKYVDLTSPSSFGFFAIVTSNYGTHTYVYPHVKQGHRWGAAGSYQVGVQASPSAGGDYTLCVNLNSAQ